MAFPPATGAPPNFGAIGKKSLKKAAGRRIKAPVPSNKGGGGKKVATFANPGNKAGNNLTQTRSMPPMAPGEGPAGAAGILGALMSAPSKKPKTKVQPAAARRFAALKMSAGK